MCFAVTFILSQFERMFGRMQLLHLETKLPHLYLFSKAHQKWLHFFKLFPSFWSNMEGSWTCFINPTLPGLFCYIRDLNLNICGLGGVRLPIKRIHEVWMPRTLQKNVWLLKLLFVKEAFDPIRKGPPLWNLGISDELYFQGNEITLRG